MLRYLISKDYHHIAFLITAQNLTTAPQKHLPTQFLCLPRQEWPLLNSPHLPHWSRVNRKTLARADVWHTPRARERCSRGHAITAWPFRANNLIKNVCKPRNVTHFRANIGHQSARPRARVTPSDGATRIYIIDQAVYNKFKRARGLAVEPPVFGLLKNYLWYSIAQYIY